MHVYVVVGPTKRGRPRPPAELRTPLEISSNAFCESPIARKRFMNGLRRPWLGCRLPGCLACSPHRLFGRSLKSPFFLAVHPPSTLPARRTVHFAQAELPLLPQKYHIPARSGNFKFSPPPEIRSVRSFLAPFVLTSNRGEINEGKKADGMSAAPSVRRPPQGLARSAGYRISYTVVVCVPLN